MADPETISIVTISFNQAEFLPRTLESVLGQDYQALDYIVVDPGSTDGSREILAAIDDPRLTLVLQPDKGPAHGLNKGFARAGGSIWGYLNSDDTLRPGALSRVAHEFAGNPELDMIFGHAAVIDAEDRHIRWAHTDPIHLTALAYGACILVQQSTFFRPRLFHEIGGFNPENRIAWDGELFDRMLKAGARYRRIDAALSGFRIHPASISGALRGQEARAAYEAQRFRLLMGRDWEPKDRWLRWGWLARKYLIEPRALWERLAHGPAAGRYKPEEGGG